MPGMIDPLVLAVALLLAAALGGLAMLALVGRRP